MQIEQDDVRRGSADERQKLVFRVKLRLTDPGAVPQAKPGMPGAGYVRTAEVDWPANLQ